MKPDDATIEDPMAAMRYLLARAEAKGCGVWVRGRTLPAGVARVRVRLVHEVEIAVPGRMPDEGERYRIEQALTHLGLETGPPEPDTEANLVRFRVSTPPAGQGARG